MKQSWQWMKHFNIVSVDEKDHEYPQERWTEIIVTAVKQTPAKNRLLTDIQLILIFHTVQRNSYLEDQT